MSKVLKTNPCFDSSNFNFETRTELIQGPDLIVFCLRALYFSVFFFHFHLKRVFIFKHKNLLHSKHILNLPDVKKTDEIKKLVINIFFSRFLCFRKISTILKNFLFTFNRNKLF